MSNGDDLDPEIRKFQRAIAASYAAYPEFGSASRAERRRIAEIVRAPWRAGGPTMAQTQELEVGERSVRIRILHPCSEPEGPAFIYLHGGGWTIFSIDTHDRLMREYAHRAQVTVVGIDYSLSPEAKFPTAIEDVLSVIQWLKSSGSEHHIDARCLAIGGDSAGANLAVSTALSLRDLGKKDVRALLLNYGAFTSMQDGQSYQQFDGDSYNLTAAEMASFWSDYVRDEKDFSNPLVCPLQANLNGLPPTFFAIAACDILADENVALANRMEKAGIPTEVNIYQGATHSFLEAVSISSLAERALDDASSWLHRQLTSRAQ